LDSAGEYTFNTSMIFPRDTSKHLVFGKIYYVKIELGSGFWFNLDLFTISKYFPQVRSDFNLGKLCLVRSAFLGASTWNEAPRTNLLQLGI
jgi:hypothetical protein